MSNQLDHILIDYLDHNLPEQEMQSVAAQIETDAAVNEQWQYLQVAVEAVQHNALHEQVAAVKKQYAGKGKVRTMTRVLRIAAVLVVAIAGIGLTYKYVTTNAAGIYKEAYVSYNLNISRSSTTINEIEKMYNSRNWKGVIDIFNKTAEKDNEAWFLAGMANMELQQYAPASQQFEQVLMHNTQTGDDYFQDEAEYYLALSYLAQNRVKEASALLEKIKADTSHLFNKQASRISGTDLKISSFKSGK